MSVSNTEQITAERIKKLAKAQGISVSELLNRSALGINTISNLSKGKDLYSRNLEKIADVLNCSVDYLLGRANAPDPKTPLTDSEAKLLSAYRAHPEMQSAVDKLLGVEHTENIEDIKTISEINDYLSESAQDFAAFTTEQTEDYSDDTPDIL